MLESAVRKVGLKVHSDRMGERNEEVAQLHPKSLERCEQTQICSRLCELRRDSVIRVQCFHLSEKMHSYPELSLLFINTQEQWPKGEGLEENKTNNWKFAYILKLISTEMSCTYSTSTVHTHTHRLVCAVQSCLSGHFRLKRK